MGEIVKDLHNNSLEKEDGIIITYEGPSFENRMEISYLREQLKSLEYLIKDLVDELYENEGLNLSSKDVKIFLKLRKGSFEEIISIIFSNSIVSGIISGCVVAFFSKLVNKKKECEHHIEKLVNNFYFVKNAHIIVNPLSQEGDKLKIKSRNNPENEVELLFEEKEELYKKLREIEKESLFETYEEEFFGHLSSVNLGNSKFGFTLEGTNKPISVKFDKHLSLKDIKTILGERIKITARAKYKDKQLFKLEIIDHELKKRKTLNDF